MIHNPLITIVIPYYNASGKIIKCLTSLKAQTSNNFLVVFIDDRSTDNSKKVIQSELRDSNIKYEIIRNKKNIGPGYSRNVGINKTTTEYITFLDSDDSIDEEYIEVISNEINKSKPDCICFDYSIVSKTKVINNKTIPNCAYGNPSVNMSLANIIGSTWGKVYKTEIIKNNKVKFPHLSRKEDMVFTKIAISNCKVIRYINKPLYNYIMRNDSLMHDDNLLDEQNSIDAFEMVWEKIHPEYHEELEYILTSECIYPVIYIMSKKQKRNKDIRKTIKSLREKYKYKKNSYYKYLQTHKKIILFLYEAHLLSLLKFFTKASWGSKK
ncbi:glycosyltransferase [Candidatus Saccharibacteria bacterium]|nr:glycosyltransferase [Candidatus Saccharibacteria bacterium]